MNFNKRLRYFFKIWFCIFSFVIGFLFHTGISSQNQNTEFIFVFPFPSEVLETLVSECRSLKLVHNYSQQVLHFRCRFTQWRQVVCLKWSYAFLLMLFVSMFFTKSLKIKSNLQRKESKFYYLFLDLDWGCSCATCTPLIVC